MVNRLTRRRIATGFGLGCIFAALVMVQSGGAAAVAFDMFATGDTIVVSSDVTWIAGTSDLNSMPPLDCGGEVLMGGHSTRIVGPGSYQSSGLLDSTELMLYQFQTDALIGGIYRESLYADGCGSPWSESACGPMPDTDDDLANASAYCSGASFNTLAMGRHLNIATAGATVQAGDTPDTLAATTRITGDGMARIQFETWNQVGIGNTTGLGYQASTRHSSFVDGKAMDTGATFAWSSFAGLWAESPEETG